MRLALRAALVGFALLVALTPAAAVERILYFLSDVSVEQNGDLDVTETIRVQAEGRVIRRGILRDFPTRYSRANGSRVDVGFRVLSVMRDGAPEQWSTEGITNGVRVRIGNPDRTLENGPHEYVIRYRTTRQIGFFADYDELYWNVTGTGWDFAIDSAEARISLPRAVPFKQVAVYTGAQGAQGRDASVVSREPGHIVFRTTRPLPPRNGLTVAAAWEKGLVQAPSSSDVAGYWLTDNLTVIVALAGLLIVLAYYYWAWLRVGRDPRRGTIIPLFGPPEGMSAAAVRFIHRMAFDPRCFTAAIVDLGVNGHLRLTGTGKATVIHQRSGGKPIPPPERAMETKLFAANPSIGLVQSNHTTLSGARDALKSGLADTYVGPLFANNYGWSAVGALLAVVAVLATVISVLATHGGDDGGNIVMGMLFPLPFILGGAITIYAGRGQGQRVLSVIVGAIFLIVPLMFGAVFVLTASHGWIDDLPALMPYLLAIIVGVSFRWLKAPTLKGRAVMDQIDGFRQYLGVAEEARLEALNPPEKTPELFERFLPFAIALDVENTWAARFAAVLAAAGAAAAASTWYAGQNMATNPTGFAHELGSSLSSTIASASSAPGSSSGSGGGGSSGGGGGGGGGGGW